MNLLFETLGYRLFFPVEGAIYFAIISAIYFALPWVKARVFWLLMVSYVFYMYWNPIFIVLIIGSSLVDYLAARFIANTENIQRRKLYLSLSILVNLGILFYFKYYNFLRENIQFLIDTTGMELTIPAHSWLLPIGISFYTFQTLSYTIDVYRGHQKVEKNFFIFGLYVSFFPQLIAGPIERTTNLLPQFRKKQNFDYKRVRSGLLLILLGLFKKIVIADRFAVYSDEIFNNPTEYTGMAAIMGMFFFSFQIYCDFSGYTDMAIGAARVLGYRLMENFKGPYFSKSIQEFWRRWHISLSTWFRDYLYIPLGGNRGGTYQLYRNLIIVFLVTGIWHGANWTFVVWGLFHGFFLIVERIGGLKILKNLPSVVQIFYTFIITSLGWVFFRANSMSDAVLIFQNFMVFDESFFSVNIYDTFVDTVEFKISMVLMIVIAIIHYWEYKIDIVNNILSKPLLVRWSIYILLIYSITLLGQYGEAKPFIYFQF